MAFCAVLLMKARMRRKTDHTVGVIERLIGRWARTRRVSAALGLASFGALMPSPRIPRAGRPHKRPARVHDASTVNSLLFSICSPRRSKRTSSRYEPGSACAGMPMNTLTDQRPGFST